MGEIAPALDPEQLAHVEHTGIHVSETLDRSIVFDAEVERITAHAEAVRVRLSPAPTEGMLKTPDEMIDDLEWAKYGTGRIALVLKEADGVRRRARRAFDTAHGLALLASDGKSSEQREAEAAGECLAEREALDEAEIAYDFARSVARSVEGSASMTQTQASLVKAQLNLAGTGRES